MELMGFTKDDWAAYSGCETDNPYIAHSETFNLIVDGDHVQIERVYEAGSFFETWRFPDVSDAMLFALQVRGTETGDILVIKALAMGGRNVG